MAAIISDKFRIFNAKQFLESLTEGPSAASAERTRMYFFVGRPQPWRAYLEIYSKGSTSFTVGDEVYVGTYGSTTFRATIAAVYDSALLLTDVFGSNGVNSTPSLAWLTLSAVLAQQVVLVDPTQVLQQKQASIVMQLRIFPLFL